MSFSKSAGQLRELKKEIAALIATVKEQRPQIEKVRAKLEVRKFSNRAQQSVKVAAVTERPRRLKSIAPTKN
jgi:GTPase